MMIWFWDEDTLIYGRKKIMQFGSFLFFFEFIYILLSLSFAMVMYAILVLLPDSDSNLPWTVCSIFYIQHPSSSFSHLQSPLCVVRRFSLKIYTVQFNRFVFFFSILCPFHLQHQHQDPMPMPT